jgi:hypothetical protein
MAQWKKPHRYENVGERLANALSLLRCAAERFARADGAHALCPAQVARLMAHVIRSEFVSFPLDICAAVQQIDLWNPPTWRSERCREAWDTALPEMTRCLAMAARDWAARGDAESPPTATVLHELATILFRHGLMRLPPPKEIQN